MALQRMKPSTQSIYWNAFECANGKFKNVKILDEKKTESHT